MSPDAEEPDRLLRAIGEFREELLLWIDTALVRLCERDQLEGLDWEVPRNPERRAERDSVAETARPPAAASGPETAAGPQAPASLDPRRRLDALARLLDHRLKQAEGPAGQSPEAP